MLNSHIADRLKINVMNLDWKLFKLIYSLWTSELPFCAAGPFISFNTVHFDSVSRLLGTSSLFSHFIKRRKYPHPCLKRKQLCDMLAPLPCYASKCSAVRVRVVSVRVWEKSYVPHVNTKYGGSGVPRDADCWPLLVVLISLCLE